MRISDWSSDVCSSDLRKTGYLFQELLRPQEAIRAAISDRLCTLRVMLRVEDGGPRLTLTTWKISAGGNVADNYWREGNLLAKLDQKTGRSEEHTSELQSLMRISYAVFCLKKKTNIRTNTTPNTIRTIHTNQLYK